MKKITLRFSSLILACVPFLIAGSSIVQANDSVNNETEETIQKNTADTTTDTSDTTSSSKTEITNEIEKNETTPLPLTTQQIETTISNKGMLNVAKYKEIELKGQFTPKKYNTIEIDKDGNWKALKAGTESITVEFTPDEKILALLKESYPDDNFNTPFKSAAIAVTVAETVPTPPSSTNSLNTTDTIDDKLIEVPLILVENPLKATEGKLEVKVKDGEKVTGTFSAPKSENFILKDDKGTYSIPEAAQEKNLKETVTFTLDETSVDSLTKNEAYKGKNIETKYEFEVTKKAQKNIVLTFKNLDLNSTKRLVINDTVENVPDIKFEVSEFVPFSNEYISIDKNGNWKSLKTGETTIQPEVVLTDDTMKALQAKYPDMDLNITTEAIKLSTSTTTGSSTSNSKTYAPASNLPKTGEEKLRFAGIIGVIVILLAGALFLLKRNKNKDEE